MPNILSRGLWFARLMPGASTTTRVLPIFRATASGACRCWEERSSPVFLLLRKSPARSEALCGNNSFHTHEHTCLTGRFFIEVGSWHVGRVSFQKMIIVAMMIYIAL